jgi:hypothetical protein
MDTLTCLVNLDANKIVIDAEGNIILVHFKPPITGKTLSFSANMYISISAIQGAGSDIPRKDTALIMLSCALFLYNADIIPNGSAIIVAISIVIPASLNVAGKAFNIKSTTGLLYLYEIPKSPFNISVNQSKY